MGVRDWLKRRADSIIDRQLGPDLLRRRQALVLHENEFGYDAFGFHKASLGYPMLAARWLYETYFRCDAHGVDNIPADGRCLIVANHSGQLPFDGLVIATAVFIEAPQARMIRSMVEHFVPTVPFMSYLLSRWGQITGTPENCLRLLEADEAILVFPEGARGISKPYSQRYQLADFGLGFMRLALATGTPIIPVAVIGAEEQAPAVNVKPLARLFGAPSFPLVPYPPFVPLVPLPVKYRLYFGEPISFTGDPDDDDDVLGDQVAVVRDRIQAMIQRGLEEREHVFW